MAEVLDFLRVFTDSGLTITVNTSGSTGIPKPIELEKSRMIASAKATLTYFNLQPQQKALLCLPVKYIAGKMMVIRALVGELDMMLAEPSSNPLQQLPKETHLHFAAMIPMQVKESLSDLATTDQFKSIEQVIIGGGAIPSVLETQLKSLPNKLYATYGMTETITHIAVRKINHSKTPDQYEALPNVKFWQDERACLQITAPAVCSEQLTTNDVVELLDYYHFKWLGRFDHVVNSGGVKLHPERIEKQLEQYLDRRFFLCGRPDERLGEQLMMVIEGEPLDKVTEKLLRNFMEEQLERFEVPKVIEYRPQFEETPTGKVIRR